MQVFSRMTQVANVMTFKFSCKYSWIYVINFSELKYLRSTGLTVFVKKSNASISIVVFVLITS